MASNAKKASKVVPKPSNIVPKPSYYEIDCTTPVTPNSGSSLPKSRLPKRRKVKRANSERATSKPTTPIPAYAEATLQPVLMKTLTAGGSSIGSGLRFLVKILFHLAMILLVILTYGALTEILKHHFSSKAPLELEPTLSRSFGPNADIDQLLREAEARLRDSDPSWLTTEAYDAYT